MARTITTNIPIPISGLTVGGNRPRNRQDKGKNIFALGLIAKMFDLNVPKLENLIGERFTGKDSSILTNALNASMPVMPIPSASIIETFSL